MIAGWQIFVRDLIEQWPLIFDGLIKTIELTVIISITGFIAGIAVFYFRYGHSKLIRKFFEGYISFFIGTPLLVLLFLAYYGLPKWGISWTPLTVAVVGFTLNIGAYNAAYLSSAYRSLDTTELEAARSQGMTSFQVFWFVTLPQVLRLSIPALTNQLIRNLKDTSIVFLIQYTEFFARVQELASGNFRFFNAYLFASCVYLALVSVIAIVAIPVQRRLLRPYVR